MTKVTNNFQSKQRYSHKERPKARRSIPELANFKILMFGILIGVFSTSLFVFIFSPTDITLKIPTSGSEASLSANNIQAAHLAELPVVIQEPQFDFYSELTKNVPESSPVPVNTASVDLKSQPKAIDSYIIQAGPFRKNSEADSIRAKLMLNGFSGAKVEPLKLADGEIRHRIVMGPFKTEKQAQALQQQLKGIEIDTIVKTL